MVSVSKHYYLSKDGLLKYQKKPFEVALATLTEQTKAHLVVMNLRDHFSSLFFAQIAPGPMLPDIFAFLRSAWEEKVDHPLYGLPDLLLLPKTVEAAYPGIADRVRYLGVELGEVTSGFQSGIRDMRTIESAICMSLDKPFSDAGKWLALSQGYQDRNKARTGEGTKSDLWRQHVRTIKELPHGWSDDA